jgi:hypothetical protein
MNDINSSSEPEAGKPENRLISMKRHYSQTKVQSERLLTCEKFGQSGIIALEQPEGYLLPKSFLPPSQEIIPINGLYMLSLLHWHNRMMSLRMTTPINQLNRVNVVVVEA